MRKCADCGAPIENRHPTAKRCIDCAERNERELFHKKIASGQYKRGPYKTIDFKKATHQQQGDSCIICGWSIPGKLYGGCVAHHIISLSGGGSNTPDNGAIVCPNCHELAHYGSITEDELHIYASKAIKNRLNLNKFDLINKIREKVDGHSEKRAVF